MVSISLVIDCGHSVLLAIALFWLARPFYQSYAGFGIYCFFTVYSRDPPNEYALVNLSKKFSGKTYCKIYC